MKLEPIQVKPYTGQGPTGQKTYGALRAVQQAVIWPRTSDEVDAGGAVIDGLNIYIPPNSQGLEIKAQDRILARGKEWDIDGTPGEYQSGSGEKTLLMTKKVGS